MLCDGVACECSLYDWTTWVGFGKLLKWRRWPDDLMILPALKAAEHANSTLASILWGRPDLGADLPLCWVSQTLT